MMSNTKHKNTPIWRYVVAAGKDIYGRSWRRRLADLFGVAPGRLRYVVDSDLPDDIIAEIERQIVEAARDKRNAAHGAHIEAKNVFEDIDKTTTERAERRMRQRLAADPTEAAVFRKLVMEHTPFFDEAERLEYEREFS